WYHALFARHAGLQSAVNGMDIRVAPRRREDGTRQCWDVEAREQGGVSCHSTLEVIGWDAIVRAHWPRNATGVLLQSLRAYAGMIRHMPGELLKVGRIAPRTLFALAYPLLFFVGGSAFVLAAAALLGWILALAAGQWVGLAAAAVAGLAGMHTLLRLERRLDTSLLARIFAFVWRYAVQGIPALDAVLDGAVLRIRELLQDPDCDELLVVGYSVGSILATRAVGRALAADAPRPGDSPRLALLTLGNCIPLLGLYPHATAYREELARIGQSDRLVWIDVSSPTDWGSFPLLDPLAVCEVEVPRRGTGYPRPTSPRFHTLFSGERYRAMVGDKHTMHALYLMSTEKPGRYDWFAITTGCRTLAARYAVSKGPPA
ncbi:MAG: hypothetical protein ACKO4A_05655, partial [Gammaproteobacteria bacterium]